MREDPKYRDRAYYDHLFDQVEQIIARCLDPDNIKEQEGYDPVYKGVEISDAGKYYLENIRTAYSRGDEPSVMRMLFEKGMHYLWLGEQCFNERGRYSPHDVNVVAPTFSIPALVFALGLGYERSVIELLARFIPEAGRDRLVDTLYSNYDPDRKIGDHFKESARDKPLIKVIEASAEKRPGLLKKYLDSWPKRLGRKAPDGMKPWHTYPSFDGYWCYSAAAVVAVYDIDDSSFINHEFYPTELMQWRREGVVAEHTMPLQQMQETVSCCAIETNTKTQGKPIKKLTEALANSPANRYRPLFDLLYAHLPEPAQEHLWATVAEYALTAEEGEDFIDMLYEALDEADMHARFGLQCLLYVDWKDLESAIGFSARLVKDQGIEAAFDYDPVEAGDPIEAPIPVYLNHLDDWLKPKGYRYLSIDTGGDCYAGFVIQEPQCEQVIEQARKLGLSLSQGQV